MTTLSLSPNLVKKSFTMIDNTFILEYMPFAPDLYTKVYVLGLALAVEGNNDISHIAIKLNIDKSLVIESFMYWKEQEVVNISQDNEIIEFLPIIPQSRRVKKFNKDKYKIFNDQLHIMIKDRVISINEYNEYYSIMENLNIEVEAMLTIIGYCIRLKGADIGYPYILAVARNLAHDGCTTYERVQERLSELDLQDSDLRAVLKALKVKKTADHNDRNLFLKWKNEFGFKVEAIIQVAKQVKKGGILALDMLLTRYFENKLFSIDEINSFNEEREKLYAIASKITKTLGLRYDRLDYIIENYILTWTMSGFEEDALFAIAEYCFKRSIRDIEGMSNVVNKFYKQGLISLESINEFFNMSVRADDDIKKVFTICNITRQVTSRDREFYKTWVTTWKHSSELIEYAASLSKDKAVPIAYMNTILASYFEKKIISVDDAKKQTISKVENVTDKKTTASNQNLVNRNLSAEELNAMFDRLSDDF